MTAYDCSPVLTSFEQEGLHQLLIVWRGQERLSVPKGLEFRLLRLLQSLYDLLDALGILRRSGRVTMAIVCRGMYEYGSIYWNWPGQQWVDLFTDAILRYPRGHTSANANRQPCYQLLTFAYFIGPRTDFWLPLLKEISPLAFARLLFGEEVLEAALTRVTGALSTWGYLAEAKGARLLLRTTLVEVFLINRSAHLEQVTPALLDTLHKQLTPQSKQAVLERVSKALAHMGIIDAPLLPAQ